MTTYSAHDLGSGHPLVLAHGAGGSVLDNFAPLSTALPGRRLIGQDYPGSNGRPAQSEPLALSSLAAEMVGAAREAGLDRFPVLGLSLGAAVAMTAALEHPDSVSALVLTVGFGEVDSQLRTFARLYASLARQDRIGDLVDLLMLADSPDSLAALTPTGASDAAQDRRRRLHGTAAGMAAQFDLVTRIDVTPEQIAVPVLVVAAGQDRIVLPSSTRQLAARIPGAELVELPDAGHIFTAAETITWAGHVEAFLSRHDG